MYSIMFSSLVKRALLDELFYELIFFWLYWSIKIFIVAVCCIILFPFSIWLAAATNTTFIRSKHQRYSSCKQKHCNHYYGCCLVGPPSLLLAAITTVVKNGVSQQYYIFFLHFVGSGSAAVAAQRQRWRQRQCNDSSQLGSRGGSLAEVQFWRQRQRQHIGKHGSSVAAAQRRQRQCGVGVSSMAYADNDCNGNDDNNYWLLIASQSLGRGGRGRRINQASIWHQSCQGAQAGGDDLS